MKLHCNLFQSIQQLEAAGVYGAQHQSMLTLLQWLKNVDPENEILAEVDLDEFTVTSLMKDEDSSENVVFLAMVAQDVFFLHLLWEKNLAVENIPEASRLLFLLNHQLKMGHFLLNEHTGECFFKISHFFGNVPMNEETMNHLAVSAIDAVNSCKHLLQPLLRDTKPHPASSKGG